MLTPEQIAADEATIQLATPTNTLFAINTDGALMYKYHRLETKADHHLEIVARTRWPLYVEEVKRLRAAIVAKLKDCRDVGDCSDAALMDGEYCSDECSALATLVDPKALADPPCKTCGGTKQIRTDEYCTGRMTEDYRPCPDCRPSKEKS